MKRTLFTLENMDGITRDFVEKHPRSCAVVLFSRGQKWFYALLALAALLLLKYRWDVFIFTVTALLVCCYLSAALFRGLAALLSACGRGEDRVTAAELEELPNAGLPVYTVLVPLYKEANIAAKLLANLAKLDYPSEKLDVKLLLEADDAETLAALKVAEIPAYCEIIVVPDSLPKTKPRACNYGLAAARGEYCVIFDAEDAPEPDQLRKALAVFRRDAGGRVACVQAKLNYFNSRVNWLTRLFTVEYSVNFDLMLAGMQLFNLPLPLGGTSNHFRTDLLRKIGPWDPFNVTEDCDLGLRIYEHGFRTKLVDSTTWEEANSELGNWLRQRSRWVKGFLQTHLVHYRNPLRTIRRLGLWGAFGGYLAIGGSVLMMLANVVCWLVLAVYAVLLAYAMAQGAAFGDIVVGPHSGADQIAALKLGNYHFQVWPLVYIGENESPLWSGLSQFFFGLSVVLFFANLWFVLVGVAACCKRKFYHLIPAALLLPVYWILISIGAWKGFIQLFTNPFYWEKTRHGLSDSTEGEHGR
jgi:cellulose synthase/poly-beta-1,6-N-acetylglucosamine synthase-like glycosyltransferase